MPVVNPPAAGAWHVVGADGEAAFENSWVNYGAGTAIAAFYKDASGLVVMKGVVKDGTISTPIFILPVGYRPIDQNPLPYNSLYGFGPIVAPNGDVAAPGANASVPLFGCWRAEQ